MKRRRLEAVLAKRLRELSDEHGVPLSHWADRAGIARSYFWLLLDQKSSATLEMVQRLAEVVREDPIDLLTEGGVRVEGLALDPKGRPTKGGPWLENPVKRPARRLPKK